MNQVPPYSFTTGALKAERNEKEEGTMDQDADALSTESTCTTLGIYRSSSEKARMRQCGWPWRLFRLHDLHSISLYLFIIRAIICTRFAGTLHPTFCVTASTVARVCRVQMSCEPKTSCHLRPSDADSAIGCLHEKSSFISASACPFPPSSPAPSYRICVTLVNDSANVLSSSVAN